MEPQYRIVFSGEIREGLSPTKVRANVAARLSVGAQQIERIFSGKPVVLKNGVSEAAGIAYGERLSRLGMVVSMEPMPGSTPPAAIEPPQAEAPEAAPASASTPFPTLDSEPQAEPLTTAPEAAPSAAVAAITPPAPAPKKPIRSNADEAWLSSSSFANLARTHLNLARAEALLNGSEYTGSIITPPEERPWPPLETEAPPTQVEALVETDSAPEAEAPAVEAPAPAPAPEPATSSFVIIPGTGPENSLVLSGSFLCSECGTTHQVHANIQIQLTKRPD